MPLPKDSLFYGLRERMNEEQEYYVNSIIDYHVVFSNSPAGTGKTTLAVAALYYLYQQNQIDKVYYVFSPVEERQMGYRPGSQQEKEYEYTSPLRDALAAIDQMPDKALDPKHGWVEAKSHTFMRGVNLKSVGVLVDEAQNWTVAQLKKLITRVDDRCRLVIIGHEGQIDLSNPQQSGFMMYLRHFETLKDKVRVCPLTVNYRGWISQWADTLEV
jgi:phosphate starvation-inducible PhoH-like protein